MAWWTTSDCSNADDDDGVKTTVDVVEQFVNILFGYQKKSAVFQMDVNHIGLLLLRYYWCCFVLCCRLRKRSEVRDVSAQRTDARCSGVWQRVHGWLQLPRKCWRTAEQVIHNCAFLVVIIITSGQCNLTKVPHRCRTWTVRLYLPGGASVLPA